MTAGVVVRIQYEDFLWRYRSAVSARRPSHSLHVWVTVMIVIDKIDGRLSREGNGRRSVQRRWAQT